MARRLGQRIKYGELCTCNKCHKEYLKTKDNFYFNSKGEFITYTCKGCYQTKQKLIRLGIYKTATQTHIKEGHLCKCVDCGKSFKKNSENFYYLPNGNIKTYSCKECYKAKAKAATKKRRKLGIKIEKKVAQIKEKTLLEIVKTRTFPKGHPMNPTKEQRQALIDKIESRRVYKNESRND
jgi:hypothetical protein